MAGKHNVKAVDNVAKTSDLFSDKFSISRTALEYFGGKR